MLLEKAYEALPPQGAVIVYERMIDDERCVNATALLDLLISIGHVCACLDTARSRLSEALPQCRTGLDDGESGAYTGWTKPEAQFQKGEHARAEMHHVTRSF